jgi:hypothetical protein
VTAVPKTHTIGVAVTSQEHAIWVDSPLRVRRAVLSDFRQRVHALASQEQLAGEPGTPGSSNTVGKLPLEPSAGLAVNRSASAAASAGPEAPAKDGVPAGGLSAEQIDAWL